MALFLLSFLAIYGGMHIYAYVRIDHSFRFSRPAGICFRLWMLFTTGAPFLVRLCEESGWDLTARFIAWPGFVWMGFIFILVTLLLVIDTCRLCGQMLANRRRVSPLKILRLDVTAEIAMLLALVISAYGFYEASSIRAVNLQIQSAKLPPGSPPVRIVQISDVHLGLIIREGRLKEMLAIVEKARPDILVSTGDMVDGRLSLHEGIKYYRGMIKMLASVPAPMGKFAVLGNHEVYAGLQQSIEITEASGFSLLRNNAVTLPAGITVSGIDDQAVWLRQSGPQKPDESALLRSLPPNSFRLHLKHRPEVSLENQGLFDLQLSGHTHRGQIFPFYLLTKVRFQIPSGTTLLQNGSRIHVSNGTGTWGPPIRFLAPPEVTIIDIIPTAP